MIGSRYLVIILLIGLSISILAGQELNQLSIVGKVTRATGEIVPHDKLDANMNQAALISFITDLDVDMDFRPWNGAVGKITNPAIGRWNVYVSPEERAIDVHAEGFEPLKVVLSSFGINSVKSGDVYHIKITGEMKAAEVPVMISCNQSGAKVIVDDEEMGSTVNKMLAIKVNSGERKLRIVKDGFASQEISETVSLTNYSFHFELEPAMKAVVKITTEPEGAEIFLEGNVKLGTTPLEIFYDADTYPIKIEKENYETINEQITIIEPRTEKHYKMTDIRASLTVKTHANATVKFNGKEYKGGIDKLKISPQVLQIIVEMPKAEELTRAITLKAKAEEILEMYPEVQTGVIQVMCIPMDANIELSGDAGEHYTSKGRKSFTDVPVGNYNLIVSADGYKTHKEDFRLNENETIPKQVTLEEGSDVPEFIETIDNQSVHLTLIIIGSIRLRSNNKLVYRNKNYKIYNISSKNNIYVVIPKKELSNKLKNVVISGRSDVTGTIDKNETYITLKSN